MHVDMGKHKKNKRDNRLVPEQEAAAECVLESDVPVKKKKKKSKQPKMSEVEEENLDQPNTTNDCLNGEHVKNKKKKKNKIKQKTEDNEADYHPKEKMCEIDSKPEEVFEGKTLPKKKNKKKKHIDIPCELVAETASVEEPGSICKKKKKRKHEPSDCEEATEYNTVASTPDESGAHKKKKKRRSDDCSDTSQNSESVAEEVNIKHRIGKVRNESKIESENGNVLKSAQEGHSFTRGKYKEGGVLGNTSEHPKPVTGQWNTASLGDENRQKKFLRLLGGFKTGGDTSVIKRKFSLDGKLGNTKSDYQSTGRLGGSFAMDKMQEEVYIKTMEKDYDRAMVSNMNRGIGLGFTKPEEGKRFFIDTNKSKSVKFND